MNLSVAKKMDRVFYTETHTYARARTIPYIALPTFHKYMNN